MPAKIDKIENPKRKEEKRRKKKYFDEFVAKLRWHLISSSPIPLFCFVRLFHEPCFDTFLSPIAVSCRNTGSRAHSASSAYNGRVKTHLHCLVPNFSTHPIRTSQVGQFSWLRQRQLAALSIPLFRCVDLDGVSEPRPSDHEGCQDD